jgi:hypothetical protein
MRPVGCRLLCCSASETELKSATHPPFSASIVLNSFNLSLLHIIQHPFSTQYYIGFIDFNTHSTPNLNTIVNGLRDAYLNF